LTHYISGDHWGVVTPLHVQHLYLLKDGVLFHLGHDVGLLVGDLVRDIYGIDDLVVVPLLDVGVHHLFLLEFQDFLVQIELFLVLLLFIHQFQLLLVHFGLHMLNFSVCLVLDLKQMHVLLKFFAFVMSLELLHRLLELEF
jgi:hypothetical protein